MIVFFRNIVLIICVFVVLIDRNSAQSANQDINDTKEEDLQTSRQDAFKMNQIRERKKAGSIVVQRTLKANDSDECEWLKHPIYRVRGKLCGKHYKVLGLNREEVENNSEGKAKVKKAYRNLSLLLHPDKNPADRSEEAFNTIKEAYECLTDEECKYDYDAFLLNEERKIRIQRQELKEQTFVGLKIMLNSLHIYATKAAEFMVQFGYNVWEWAQELNFQLFDTEIPVGRLFLGAVAFYQRKIVGVLALFTFFMMKLNAELAKSKGYRFQFSFDL